MLKDKLGIDIDNAVAEMAALRARPDEYIADEGDPIDDYWEDVELGTIDKNEHAHAVVESCSCS